MAVEFLVVLPIDPIPVGITYLPGVPLPLHCTLMPWFWIAGEDDFTLLHHKLSVLASNMGANEIELVSEAPALFGPKRDVPVHILRRCERLNLLHTHLLIFLAAHASAPATHAWIGAGYRPHVTNNGSNFTVGSRHFPECMVLIERDPQKKKTVRRAYTFGSTVQF